MGSGASKSKASVVSADKSNSSSATRNLRADPKLKIVENYARGMPQVITVESSDSSSEEE